MKKLILLSLLILFSCSKEDNSGLLDQISNLQSQNSKLQSEINSLRSQVSQIPSLESQLNQALSNYENSIINIEVLEEQINSIKLNYSQFSFEVSEAFDKLNNIPYEMGVNVSTFLWSNFTDEDDIFRGAYMFEFDNDNLVTTVPYWTSYTESFNPTLNVYIWNGDCWVYIDDLSFRENGYSYIESVMFYSNNVQLKTLNHSVDANKIGLTSGYDTVTVRIYFDADINESFDSDADYSASISVFDSNNNIIFNTPWTSLISETYSDTITELCPD